MQMYVYSIRILISLFNQTRYMKLSPIYLSDVTHDKYDLWSVYLFFVSLVI